jgi:hypothetical protein
MAEYGNIEAGVAGFQTRTNNSIISKVGFEEIQFGQVMVGYKGDNKVYKFRLDAGKLVFAGDLVTSNSVIVTVNGVATTAVVFATSHANTMGLLVNAIKALTGVEAVLDTTDATSRTILVRTKGAALTMSAAVTLGGSQTTASATYLAGGFFKGIAHFVQIEGGEYPAKTVVGIVERGSLFVPTVGAVSANMPAFVNASGVFSTSGTAIPGAIYDSNTSGAGRVDLDIN